MNSWFITSGPGLFHGAITFFRDEDKKELYKGFLADMSDFVEEIKSVSLRKKPRDTIAMIARVTSQYNRHRIDLIRGKWILKVSSKIDFNAMYAVVCYRQCSLVI